MQWAAIWKVVHLLLIFPYFYWVTFLYFRMDIFETDYTSKKALEYNNHIFRYFYCPECSSRTYRIIKIWLEVWFQGEKAIEGEKGYIFTFNIKWDDSDSGRQYFWGLLILWRKRHQFQVARLERSVAQSKIHEAAACNT